MNYYYLTGRRCNSTGACALRRHAVRTSQSLVHSKDFVFRIEQNRVLGTVGPLIIESFWAEKQVSTGALEALDDPLVVQTKI